MGSTADTCFCLCSQSILCFTDAFLVHVLALFGVVAVTFPGFSKLV